jgi:hypothetical protein
MTSLELTQTLSTELLSGKAIVALLHLQALAREVELCGRVATREEAELFQYRLGALIAFCGGGVLRPSSVSGLALADHTTIAEIRASGYTGPLTMVSEDPGSKCFVLRIVTFKNMASYAPSERLSYVLSPLVSDLLSCFWRRLRPLLNPKAPNALVFVNPRNGLWFDSCRDKFGSLCGVQGLAIGASIRVIRHVVSTAVAQANVSAGERADMCAANLHTVAVADRYYVAFPNGGSASGPSMVGDFLRGLGQSTYSTSFPFAKPRVLPNMNSVFNVHACVSRGVGCPSQLRRHFAG